uniref:Tubulin--tyrosine ligase-like protein 9 n=1 Tax=Macrostomum lignano TaxID=282301 RepID=A0A1I8F225_9PLAT
MRSFGWQEVTADQSGLHSNLRENGEFDFYWIDVTLMKELFDRGFLDEHVRISHFRNHYEVIIWFQFICKLYIALLQVAYAFCTTFALQLCKKNLMVKNLKRMRKKVAKESGREEAAKYDFIPCTFELPISVQEDIAVRKSPSSLRFECIARFADALRRAQSSSAVAGLSRLSTQIASSVPQLVSNHTNLEGIESPTTALQSEYHMFVEEFKKSPGTTWIMKPAGKAQGKGIFLFRKIRDIEAWKKSSEYLPGPPDPNKEVPETYVVSRYIDNPYLVGGRKFDLRVYVLVMSVSGSRYTFGFLMLVMMLKLLPIQTSTSQDPPPFRHLPPKILHHYIPLKVYLYRDGFARFSNTRYTSDSIDDTCELRIRQAYNKFVV